MNDLLTKDEHIKQLKEKISSLENKLKWKEVHYDNLREYVNRLIRENDTPEIRMFKAKLYDSKQKS